MKYCMLLHRAGPEGDMRWAGQCKLGKCPAEESCREGSLGGFAAVVEAAKEDNAVLVHQHAVPGPGSRPSLPGQLLP